MTGFHEKQELKLPYNVMYRPNCRVVLLNLYVSSFLFITQRGNTGIIVCDVG